MSIKLNAQSGGSVALDAPTQTTSSADLTFKLPVADGSANQLLKTDGSGNLGWATDQGGKILQVVNTTYTGTATISLTNTYGNNNSNIYYYTQIDTTLTTTSANSKILISGSSSGEFSNADHLFGYVISSTIVGTTAPIDTLRGGANSNSPRLSFLPVISYHAADQDSTPSTTSFSNLYYAPSQAAGTAITIRLGITSNYDGNRSFKANHTIGGSGNSEHERGMSHMTLMEVS